MQLPDADRLLQVLKLLACLLILKIVVGVIFDYRHYMPPRFDFGFLYGRESYFWHGYQWAFFMHIVSGPCALVVGMVLLSNRFRLKFSRWHRCLGRFQTANVLLVMVPSGVWMAFYAQTGAIAGIGFAVLGVATGVCVWLGWKSAVKRQFVAHRRWMLRCYILLCSAVTLRAIGGFLTVIGSEAEWAYPLAAWMSWLVPLVAYEFVSGLKAVGREPSGRSADRHSAKSHRVR